MDLRRPKPETFVQYDPNNYYAQLGLSPLDSTRKIKAEITRRQMEAKKRPARKVFFSAKGRMAAQLKFLTEPVWAQDGKDKEREVLRADVVDLDKRENAMLEQYCPDAYDLSEALVQALGSTVVGKSAAIVARGATRQTNDGRTVSYLDGFTVTPL